MAQSASDYQAAGPSSPQGQAKASARAARGRIIDAIFRNATLFFALSTVVLIAGIAISLYIASRPNIHHAGAYIVTGREWDPAPADPTSGKMTGDVYGGLAFIYGTLLTSVIALIIAVPLGVGAAIFLAEIAPRKISTPLSFLVELLAAVPSIVYGFWALQHMVPFFGSTVEPWLFKHFGKVPFFASQESAGQDFLVAGCILALMVLPFITAISRDVLRTVPSAQREAAIGMGATRWEAIKGVVLKYGSSGIIGATMLGLGRALGETMAVTIVIGSQPNLPKWGIPGSFSFLRPGYTMSSLLADQYPNPNSPLHLSALTEFALLLFIVTIVVNGLARGLVWLTAARMGGKTTSDASLKFKASVASALNATVIVFIAAVFLYQGRQDVIAHHLSGLFGVAELIGYFLIGLVLFNRFIPGRSFYLTYRRLVSGFSLSLCGACALAACGAMIMLLLSVAHDGGPSLLHSHLFRSPNGIHPEEGGLLHAIVGTIELIIAASAFGIPFGVLGGIFLAEFGNNRLGGWTRFAADLLNGVPSIVVGIFAYTLIIVPTRSNFGWAGAFALGVLMIPTVMRTTEELVRLVPMSLREASLALGATYTKTMWSIILPAARGGIVTGSLLALARIAGETAPLLMVSCNSSVMVHNLKERVASLPVMIYVLRDDPGSQAIPQSWGCAFLLVLLVLIFSVLARFATRDKMKMTA